jgi:transposase InsO family protein
MPTAEPEGFEQLALRFTDPIQHDYEVIREVVLFGSPPAQRADETGLDRSTVSAKARRFLEEGMVGLVDQRTTKAGRTPHGFPARVAGCLLYAKQLYPPVHDRELVRLVQRKFGYRTNHHTVRAFLERHPLPVQLPLPITRFHQFEEAYQARWAVVRMYYEGWQQRSIAGILALSRSHVGEILAAFKRDEFAGLEDQRTRPATHAANQLTLPFLKEVLAIQQEYPRAGRFRVRGLLAQRTGQEPPSERTVGRAMALNRQLHGAPAAWVTDRPDPAAPDGIIKEMPYLPTHRHQYWFIDYRYLVRLGDDAHWVYSLCIIEGYSRKILAGMATEYQDTLAVLQLLAAALGESGRPEAIVSDNGAVFTAAAYEGLLQELAITVCHIEKGKPWENLIEAQFKVQLRLAEAAFERATSFAEIQEQHAAFVETFNTTPHWAHRDRADGLRTPVDVLSWVQGQRFEIERLHRALQQLQVERVVNLRGYGSVQRFYIYAERGLSRRRVSVWLYDGRRHIAHGETLLARYAYQYDRKARRLRAVEQPQLYHTSYASPQLELWELDDAQWQKVARRPYQRHPRPAARAARQLALPISSALTVLATTLQLARQVCQGRW